MLIYSRLSFTLSSGLQCKFQDFRVSNFTQCNHHVSGCAAKPATVEPSDKLMFDHEYSAGLASAMLIVVRGSSEPT
jgi:hypothetical protein